MQIPEQFKTGWLSELPSFFVVEPCQYEIKSEARVIFVTKTDQKLWPLPGELLVHTIQRTLALPYLSPPIPL